MNIRIETTDDILNFVGNGVLSKDDARFLLGLKAPSEVNLLAQLRGSIAHEIEHMRRQPGVGPERITGLTRAYVDLLESTSPSGTLTMGASPSTDSD